MVPDRSASVSLTARNAFVLVLVSQNSTGLSKSVLVLEFVLHGSCVYDRLQVSTDGLLQ